MRGKTSMRRGAKAHVGNDLLYNGQVRSQLRSGDVLLFQGNVALSRMIEAVEGGTYSHSAFVLRWGHRAMVVQAEFPRLEAVPTSIAVKKYSGRVDWYRIPDDEYAKLDLDTLTDEATRLLGRGFAVLDLLRVGLYNILEKPIPVERNDDDSLFCSEYVARCFRVAGYPLVDGTNDHAVSPDKLRDGNRLLKMGTIHWDADNRHKALSVGFATPESHRSRGHARPEPRN